MDSDYFAEQWPLMVEVLNELTNMGEVDICNELEAIAGDFTHPNPDIVFSYFLTENLS